VGNTFQVSNDLIRKHNTGLERLSRTDTLAYSAPSLPLKLGTISYSVFPQKDLRVTPGALLSNIKLAWKSVRNKRSILFHLTNNEKKCFDNIVRQYDRDIHDNASRLLIEILRASRDGQYMPASERCNDPLLATLENPLTVELLLNTMFSNPSPDSAEKHVPSESVIVNGICVLVSRCYPTFFSFSAEAAPAK
jgi:hypothetical protein